MCASLTRRKAQRVISFDALEDRMVLSAGAIEVPYAEVHSQKIHSEAKAATTITGTLKGDIQLDANKSLLLTNVRGNLGKPKLTGTGLGTIVNNQFEGGQLHFSGANGTLTFDLYGAPIKNATGSNPSFKSVAVINDATGSYAGNDGAVLGSAGNVTISWKQRKLKIAGIPASKNSEVSALSTSYYFAIEYHTLKELINLDSFGSQAYFLLNG